MTPFFVAALLLFIMAFVGLIRSIPLAFYRAFYHELHRLQGQDSKALLRKEFPRIWWLF